MNRTSAFGRVALAVSLAWALAGCGAALTAAVGGALAVAGGGKSGGGAAPNALATVPASQVVGDTSGGSVVLQLTVTDAESDAVAVEVRYSTDANEAATAVFSKRATGTLRTLGGATVDAARAPASPGGTTYAFTWNTAQDLGATLSAQVRLQVVVDGRVGNVTATFTVDNTTTPLVQSAALTLPAGATAFADEQQPGGFVPVSLVLADAESSKVSLAALLSLDGGQSFPIVAAGDLVDGSGNAVPSNAIPTSSGGTGYTFRLRSAANGLGNGGASTVVLRFQVSDTKTSKPLDTAAFVVNNADYSAVLTTPLGSQISETVDVPFLLIDGAGETLDVRFEFSTLANPPASSFVAATAVNQSPFSGTTGLASSTAGKTQHFVWNAFQDLYVLRGVVSNSTVTMRAFVTRPSTRVTRGPFPTTQFTVDHRLVQTVHGKTAGTADGILGTQSPLGAPRSAAFALNKAYFGDEQSGRIRVVDLTTGLIDTALGGGSARAQGTAAKDYFLQELAGLSAAPNGTLFVGENFNSPTTGSTYQILRVDGSTPIVTIVRFATFGARLNDLCYDRTADVVFLATNNSTVAFMTPAGFAFTQIVQQGMGAAPADDANELPRLNVQVNAEGVAANYAAYPNVVVVTERQQGRILAANLGTTPATVCGVTVSAGAIRAIRFNQRGDGSGDPLVGQPTFPAIDDAGNVYFVSEQGQVVVKLRAADGASSILAGQLNQFGFAGDGGPANAALLSFPKGLGLIGVNEAIVADSFNGLVRRVFADGTIATIAGASRPNGDGGPAAAAAFKIPLGVCLGGTGLIVPDPLASTVRQIDTATTTIARFAGNGQAGTAGDGGAPLDAAVGGVLGVTRNDAGDVYLAQYATQVVRRIRGGVVASVAGSAGVSTFTPDGTALVATRFRTPTALASNGPCVAVGSVDSQVVLLNDGPGLVTSWGLTALPGGGLGGFASARVAGDASVAAVVTPTDGSVARNVTFLQPAGVTMARNGDLYVADGRWHAVFRIGAADGLVTVIAGTPGTRADSPDGPAITRTLDSVNGVALDPLERVLYVNDARNRKLRMVNLDLANPAVAHGLMIPAGWAVTVVGETATGADGVLPDVVDGVPTGSFQNGGARNVRLDSVEGIGFNFATDASGRLYFVDGQSRVKYVDVNGTSHVLAGFDAVDGVTAASSTLRRPSAITVTPDGARYYVMDSGRIRRVDAATNVLSAFGGTGQQESSGDGGPVAQASFLFYSSGNDPVSDQNDLGSLGPMAPRQIALSTTAFVTSLMAIAETPAHAIRLVNVGGVAFVHTALGLTVPPGHVVRLAGALTMLNGLAVPASGSTGNGLLAGPGTRFCLPAGVAFTSSGLLYVSDLGNDQVRAINLSSADVSVGAVTIPPGVIAQVAAARSPRALAYEPLSHAIVLQYGEPLNNLAPPQIAVLNPSPAGQVLFGRVVAAGGLARIDSATAATTYLGPRDVPRGVAVIPVTGDALFCVRDGPSWGPGVTTPRPHQVGIVLNNRGGLTGLTTRLAGTPPTFGFGGDGGIPDDATLSFPFDVTVDATGTIYVLDGLNFRVRRFRPFP